MNEPRPAVGVPLGAWVADMAAAFFKAINGNQLLTIGSSGFSAAPRPVRAHGERSAPDCFFHFHMNMNDTHEQ